MSQVCIPIKEIQEAHHRICTEKITGEYWAFVNYVLVPGDGSTCDVSGAALAQQNADLLRNADARDRQIELLLEQLDASKAGALRYQTKFETLSELFDRFLNSTKQEKY